MKKAEKAVVLTRLLELKQLKGVAFLHFQNRTSFPPILLKLTLDPIFKNARPFKVGGQEIQVWKVQMKDLEFLLKNHQNETLKDNDG